VQLARPHALKLFYISFFSDFGMGKEVLLADTVPKRMYFTSTMCILFCSKQIKFGIFEPQEIDEVSEVEVINRELYSIAERQPVQHGVLDRRLVLYLTVMALYFAGNVGKECGLQHLWWQAGRLQWPLWKHSLGLARLSHWLCQGDDPSAAGYLQALRQRALDGRRKVNILEED